MYVIFLAMQIFATTEPSLLHNICMLGMTYRKTDCHIFVLQICNMILNSMRHSATVIDLVGTDWWLVMFLII